MKKWWAGYLLIALTGIVLALLVYKKSQNDLIIALERYRETARSEQEKSAKDVEAVFSKIYQNLRTISFLPSIRNLERDGQNLRADDHTVIQQIYNNLVDSFVISEVYIVPADIDPDATDLASNTPRAPTLMFDKFIANAGLYKNDPHSIVQDKKINVSEAAKEAAGEIEIHEYRVLREQNRWLQKNFGTIEKLNGFVLPFIGSPQIITCDNRFYSQTRRDKDREGIILSVPFYSDEGVFKGTVSAIILVRAIQNLLPTKDFALLNPAYNFTVLFEDDGQAVQSREWVRRTQSDPSLIYSEVIPLSIGDLRGKWFFWAGYPDQRFFESTAMESISAFKYSWYSFIVFVVFLSAILWAFLLHSFRLSQKNLESSVAAAAEAGRIRTDFLMRMSQELQPPLGRLEEAAQSLAQDKTLAVQTRENVESICSITGELLTLVDDFLDLSRIENHNFATERRTFDFADLLISVTNDLRPLAAQKDLTLTVEGVDRKFPNFIGDIERIERVLSTLISNAVRYTDRGSVVIEVGFEQISEETAHILLAVIDSGIGVSLDNIGFIFEKFSQENAGALRRKGGTGLGLTIIRELVEMMGGEIGVQSQVGVGTKFWIQLPVELAGTALNLMQLTGKRQDDNSKVENKRALPKETSVLIIEDNLVNQACLVQFLQRMGFNEIETALNGEEGLHKTLKAPPGIIIMDCGSSPDAEIEGPLRKICQDQNNGLTSRPVIVGVTTGNISLSDRGCDKCGVEACLERPVTLERLRIVLNRWVVLDDNIAEENAQVDLKLVEAVFANKSEQGPAALDALIDKIDEDIRKLSESLDLEKNTAWQETLRHIKSRAGVVGAGKLRNLCAKAQYKTEASLEEREQFFDNIKAVYKIIKSGLVRYRRSLNG